LNAGTVNVTGSCASPSVAAVITLANVGAPGTAPRPNNLPPLPAAIEEIKGTVPP